MIRVTDKRPIGFIDSGVGGLTVVKEALKQLPNENILYMGDAATLSLWSKTRRAGHQF